MEARRFFANVNNVFGLDLCHYVSMLALTNTQNSGNITQALLHLAASTSPVLISSISNDLIWNTDTEVETYPTTHSPSCKYTVPSPAASHGNFSPPGLPPSASSVAPIHHCKLF